MGLRAGLDWCGKSHPTGIRSPDRPARRQSLYRLSYTGPQPTFYIYLMFSTATMEEMTAQTRRKSISLEVEILPLKTARNCLVYILLHVLKQ